MKTSRAEALVNVFSTAALGTVSAAMLVSSAPLLPVIGALGMAATIAMGAITLGSFIGAPAHAQRRIAPSPSGPSS